MKIYYAETGENWRKEEKFAFLERVQSISGVEWRELTPDENHTWLTEGLRDEFATFIPIGTKEAKASKEMNVQTIFKTYSLGVSTNRDDVVYDFNKNALLGRVKKFCEEYNAEVVRYQQNGKPKNIDSFVQYEQLKWSLFLKNKLKRGNLAECALEQLRCSLYRPFTKRFIYLNDILIDVPSLQKFFTPNLYAEIENRIFYVSDKGMRSPFSVLLTNHFGDLHLCASADGFQSFAFYTYNEDGANRLENVTDWALGKFCERYRDPKIAKWDVFYYVYALLHHPAYRERYAANLKRELPRIPFAPDFWGFVEAGRRLADLHVNYERQPEYPLRHVENESVPVSFRVEKMRLSKDRTALAYNKFLTLEGVPPVAFEYRLGNRSALEWVIDQYQVTTDKRSGITSDPNRDDDPEYVVRLVKQVTSVSVETVKTVAALPPLDS
jgi:predicted helicase